MSTIHYPTNIGDFSNTSEVSVRYLKIRLSLYVFLCLILTSVFYLVTEKRGEYLVVQYLSNSTGFGWVSTATTYMVVYGGVKVVLSSQSYPDVPRLGYEAVQA